MLLPAMSVRARRPTRTLPHWGWVYCSRMLLQNKVGWVAAAIMVSLVGLWLVVPTVKAWRADRFVDELCAKDGGVRVYERLEMPLAAAKLANVAPKHLKKDADELYYVYSSSDIRGKRGSSDIGALVVFRTETALHRAKDDKLLAIAISYVRRGGDPDRALASVLVSMSARGTHAGYAP